MSKPIEIWGGVECTLNRVGDCFHDQMVWNGHYDRLKDLDRFAELGIKAIRYPALWERWGEEKDWSWLDERLNRLRELGIRPILGLVHHGSGPRDVNLLDERFVEGLAEFAGRVAERYPWVMDYTPVNEPLTTARFAALYGHWYPHARSDRDFLKALLIETRATIAAMKAIRKVQPGARLVQTEDLGKTHAVPTLAYQRKFENERRWLSFDLLCGNVQKGHKLWRYLMKEGANLEGLEPCPPDIIGVNHYVTSERFLDTDVHLYPPFQIGGNGRHRYADVEAVRWGTAEGPAKLILECWDRFHIPIAITEAHLGCTREEQIRWLAEMWEAANDARDHGADVRAVTTWALLGSFDWNSLVTRPSGYYEPGAFDVRGSAPRQTAIAHMVKDLAEGKRPEHPVLANSGWWRPERRNQGRPILITGGNGRLGRAFADACDRRNLTTRVTLRQEVDIADRASVRRVLDALQPWAVVNAAGYPNVDQAEREALQCFRENVQGASILAEECALRNIPVLTFSSDLVFDGRTGRPYQESDRTAPLNVYGLSQMQAEVAVRKFHKDALIIRTSGLFGPNDNRSFVAEALRHLTRESVFRACPHCLVSPTYVGDLVDVALDLLLDRQTGIWHLANQGAVSWLELAQRVAERAGVKRARILPAHPSELGWLAARPRYSALGSERAQLLPSLDRALDRYFDEQRTFMEELAKGA